ncbi:hypothetical protein B9Z55_007970 [Caenorhabditis nigoni]|uniref:C2 domain-containing protein n=1 Tax=Caenorhabditis nigoni TaxID=1611254 RepID=A0A2G5VCN9_9PELO|nr:hypothetical protein B9Z55_007970 [Caenorhabditis nigoni]
MPLTIPAAEDNEFKEAKCQKSIFFSITCIIDQLRPEVVSEYRGRINFSIAFEKECSTLHVHLMEAVDLPVKDFTGSSDPYVRAFLLQDPGQSERSKVHRRNLNPTFNETLSFRGKYGISMLFSSIIMSKINIP